MVIFKLQPPLTRVHTAIVRTNQARMILCLWFTCFQEVVEVAQVSRDDGEVPEVARAEDEDARVVRLLELLVDGP